MQEHHAQTRAIDPTDPLYINWVTSPIGTPPPAAAPSVAPRELGQEAVALEAAVGIDKFFAYRNYRSEDWNTCGQAAIASVTDFHGKDPYGLPRSQHGVDGKDHWADGAIIDAIESDGLGPDVVFGWGTTGGRIVDALKKYGLSANVSFWPQQPGLMMQEFIWSQLKNHIAQGLPVPVLIDVGDLGAPWYTAHWPIAYRIENDNVYLGNCSWKPIIPKEQFMYVWRCWFLPYGFNWCCVFARP